MLPIAILRGMLTNTARSRQKRVSKKFAEHLKMIHTSNAAKRTHSEMTNAAADTPTAGESDNDAGECDNDDSDQDDHENGDE